MMVFNPEERKTRGGTQTAWPGAVQKLQLADIVFVSFGKSGRTWLRVMVSGLYQQMYGLPKQTSDRF